MKAAIGWLQRTSSRSEDMVWKLQRAVAQWLSADGGAASAFHRMLGLRLVPDAFWSVRRPDADDTM